MYCFLKNIFGCFLAFMMTGKRENKGNIQQITQDGFNPELLAIHGSPAQPSELYQYPSWTAVDSRTSNHTVSHLNCHIFTLNQHQKHIYNNMGVAKVVVTSIFYIQSLTLRVCFHFSSAEVALWLRCTKPLHN